MICIDFNQTQIRKDRRENAENLYIKQIKIKKTTFIIVNFLLQKTCKNLQKIKVYLEFWNF